MKIFQNALRLHAADQDPIAKVKWDLHRLEYFYKKSAWQSSYHLYEAALNELLDDNTGLAAAWVSNDLSTLHYELGMKYNPGISEDFRWHFKSAMDYFNKGLRHMYQNNRSISVSSVVKKQHLEVAAEKIILPNSPSLIKVKTRNVTNLFLKFFNIDHPDKHSAGLNLPPAETNYRQYYSKTQPLLQVNYVLPANTDHREHHYEMSLPPLPYGSYKLAADNSGFNRNRQEPDWGLADFTVTDIGYIKDSQHPARLYLKRRSTGEALAGVEVRAFWAKKDEKGNEYIEQYLHTQSDTDGIVDLSIEDLKKHFTWVSLSLGEDKIFLGNRDLYDDLYQPESRWDTIRKEQEKYINLLFSDRAIYRPGQSIHIKGLFAVQGANGEARPNVNQRVNIRLSDHQSRGFAEKDMVTDEYGTVHWTFKIPEDLRPGKVYINTSGAQLIVHVEEYKRPRFEVTLQQPDHAYKLSSEVTVKGSARAYAGFPIENANLSYRVYREARYPIWRWWWGIKPEHAALELSSGIAATDMDGNFSISFKALGDPTVINKYQPFFIYTIQVDVTDQSGESINGTLSLNIGTQDIILDAGIAEYIEKKEGKLDIAVTATNLGSEKLQVNGTISIKRLKTPDHIMRKRLWI
ncbi:MAG: MG2 domain-containing protein, partial [Candidatus Cloacimonadaceae bacterium]|nr:MG2 domain-containing protein [Candidatus Cloacimonadaceae bacterium]